MARSVVLAILFLGFLVSALGQDTTSAPTPAGSGSTSVPAFPTPSPYGHWNLSYNSNTTRNIDLPCPKGPGHCPRTWNYTDADKWGSYCPEYATCSSGRAQSPVDVFPPVNRRGCADVPFDDFCGKRQNTTCLFNTGNYIVTPVDPATNTRFLYNGRSYPLIKVEFHTPSQHLVHGERYDLEVMYYLDSPTALGRKLVLSFFFDRPANTTDPNPATSPFLEQFVYELPEFSDCNCGNGKTEYLSDTSRFWGVNESCDDNGFNSDVDGSGACCRPNCVRAYCGDGIVDVDELCDNGTRNSNTTPGACRLNCCLPACGDGIIDPNEDCDDGNNDNFDGCSSICKYECGNGILDDVREQCDNGTANSDTQPNACRTYCRNPFCGDGVVDDGEQCDNRTASENPSQCRLNCTLPYCGDGITDLNEQCDDGEENGPSHTCNSDCSLQCGDGVVQTGEQCDDGALNSNSPNAGCRSNCLWPRCGDGVIDDLAGEQCDSVGLVDHFADRDYDVRTNIYCSSNCTQLCGNGVFDAGEECDHGCYNSDLPNRCRPNCQRPRCGDGIVDLDEECDWAARNADAPNSCRLNCTVPKCGDGWLDLGEECDDGNREEGDGCDPMCRNECGNGLIEQEEECDYGVDNANTPDKCRTNCRLPVCGDGITDSLEDCDEGAGNSDTAPNACRLNCRRPYCGDNVIDWALGEKCDFGKNNSDTEVDGCSLFCIPNYCRQRCYNTSIDWSSVQPRNTTAYSYQGSLSYPPCSEGYEYLLFASVQPLSNFQYQSFAGAPYGLYGARPVQAVNGRSFARPCVPPPPVCGNGWVEGDEECDLGLDINSDWQANRCRTNCTLPRCGDGVTDRGEECDDGQWNENIPFHRQRCDSNCRLFPRWNNPYVAKPWNYKNTCKWSYQSPEWSLCAADRVGASQSPINIDTKWESLLRYGPPVSVWPGRWETSTYKVVYTKRGLSLTIDNSTANVLNDNGKSYFLKQIDFHVRSEHTINGYHADVEADFWHQTTTGENAVLAVLFNVSKTHRSRFFSQFEFYYPHDHICRYDNGVVERYLNEECDDGPSGNSDSKPDHCRLKGKLPSIGDGIVDRGEQCDDGHKNAYKADHCRPNGWLPFCGDGIKDSNEECDFADIGLGKCTSQCTLLCGNGLIDAGEQCDNGTLNNNEFAGPWQCRNNCSLPYCGDGVCDPNEDCDDGDFNSNTLGGACRTNCRLPRCGDAVTDFSLGEECDDGANNSPTGRCLPNCRLSCGSGLPVAGTSKQCDNGSANANTDGACRTDCTLPRCGDNILDSSRGEECDPPGSGCTADCKLTCGNGVLDAGEHCDLGTANDDIIPNHCRTTCTNFTCGDGVRDWNEACDFGTQNSNGPNAPCRSNCVLPTCGDGVVDSDYEECDDGNNVSGDKCSATCQWECGNGHRDSATEECDWGVNNGLDADSCRPRGFVFNGVDLGCTFPFCGDGILDAGEQCDNGRNNSYSPNACRPDCTLPYCGDGIRDTYYGEWCDSGNLNDDFSGNCSETCIPNECRTIVPPTGRHLNFTSFFGRIQSPIVKYFGSLTRPPCTENVAYYVLTQVQPLSEGQFHELKERIHGNHRELQSLNGRQPVYYATSGPTCGNCIKEDNEECDLGSENGGWGCRTDCRKPKCGDGILDADEECDHGTNNNNSTTSPCNQWCKWVTRCPSSPCPGKKPCCGGCSGPKPCCDKGGEAEVTNNEGTIINVNFAGLLKGAGCTGPNCRN